MLYDIFSKAISLENTEREAYLRTACNGDKALLEQLRELLANDDQNKSSESTQWSSIIHQQSEQLLSQEENLIGSRVGAFKLVTRIGSGGMGTVYKAIRCDGQFEQTVAIKIIHHSLENVIGQHALIREAGFMAKFNHANIGKVFDAGVTEANRYYIIMEYIEGENIALSFEKTLMPFDQKLQLFNALCEAIRHAHQMQIIHADIKPANIIVTPEQQIKVLDFGIARMFDSRSNEKNSAFTSYLNALTANFASPELLSGGRPTVVSDVFALGKVLNTLLTTHSNNTQSKIPFQKELLAVVAKATHENPEHRYSSVESLQRDINRYLARNVVHAYPATSWYKVKKFVFARHPITSLLSISLLLMTVYFTVNLFAQNRNLTEQKKQSDLMAHKLAALFQLFDRKKMSLPDFSASTILTNAHKIVSDEALSKESSAILKLSLANSIESINNRAQAISLYKEVINEYDYIDNTDIIFQAAGELIELYTHSYELDLIHPNVGHLVDKLQYHPDTPQLPSTLAQAMFYHRYLDGTKYIQNDQEILAVSQRHIDLLRKIQAHYLDELQQESQAEVLGFLGRALMTHLQFAANRQYLFEHVNTLNFEQNIKPIIEESIDALKRAMVMHQNNGHPNNVARIKAVLTKLYISLDKPQLALQTAEETIALNLSYLGEDHNDLIQFYGELSKYFWYDYPETAIAYATQSFKLLKKNTLASPIQHLYAYESLLNAYAASGDFYSYRQLSSELFGYFASVQPQNRTKRLLYTSVLIFVKHYYTVGSVPAMANSLIEQFERTHIALKNKEESPDNYDALFNTQLFESLKQISNQETAKTKGHNAFFTAQDGEATNAKIELIREAAFKIMRGEKVENIAQAIAGIAEIQWHEKEYRHSFKRFQFLIYATLTLIHDNQIAEASETFKQAELLLANLTLSPNNVWQAQLTLLSAELDYRHNEFTRAQQKLDAIKQAIQQHFDSTSLFKIHFDNLEKKSVLKQASANWMANNVAR